MKTIYNVTGRYNGIRRLVCFTFALSWSRSNDFGKNSKNIVECFILCFDSFEKGTNVLLKFGKEDWGR